MPALKGTQPPGGSRKGIPNKITADVRAMILAALDHVGGQDYLAEQATANPKAFMSLLGRLIPTQVTGKDDELLFAGLSDYELEQKIIDKLAAKGMSETDARSFLAAR